MMLRYFRIIITLVAMALPFVVSAQATITGRILNQADTKPLANVNVFLSNATVGDKTAADGTYVLKNVKPGTYDLVVSIVGFDSYKQTIAVGSGNISLPDILIFPKTISLSEVKIKPKDDPNRERYYSLFEESFIGRSELAKDCNITNPEMLDFSYDEAAKRLTASSVDFLIIDNHALGYRIKYLLTNFVMDSLANKAARTHYEGTALFQDLEGTASQKRAWQKKRQEVYEGSPKHFLHAALRNKLEEEGFRVLQYANYQNPQRPADEVIAARIKYFKNGATRNADSLLFWQKKLKLQKTLTTMYRYPLNAADLIKPGDQKGTYVLTCDNDALHITYNKNRRFSSTPQLAHLTDDFNKDVTLVEFNSPFAFFDDNGVYTNPNSLQYTGAWAKRRMAELLPTDYEPPYGDNAIPSKGPDDKLEEFKSTHIAEQAYLHFDKPYYAAGDTLYFKAYVTVGERHELSALSGVLHVELINTRNKVDQSLLLKINNGVCWGDFALPDSLPKGEYRVRAYTKWMLNDGDEGVFSRTLPVGSAAQTKVAESATRLPATVKPDLQFFPEGGVLISGVKSKIAFKAIGANGLGIDAKGTVTDNAGNSVTTFASTHLGMGYIDMIPEAGKSYKANITFADGSQNTIDLPVPSQQGIALAVNNDSLQKATVFINADKRYFEQNRGKAYELVIYSGGVITSVNCPLDSATLKFDLAKRRLHTGVNTVTLFSPAGEPMSERLFFVQNYDKLSLNVGSDKSTYSAREKVNIKITAKNRADSTVAGHFSISVIDEGKVPVDENAENTILSSLLLTDDLKGTVEQPNYYFNNITPETLKSLDLVMLTHGYRRFEWKEVLGNSRPPALKPETGVEISGVAETQGGKPLKNGIVTLIRINGGGFLTDTTDDNGNFKFSNLEFLDSTSFVLQAVTKDGNRKTQLVYKTNSLLPVTPLVHHSTDVNQQITTYINNRREQLDEYKKYGDPKGIMLKEVKVREQKLKDNYRSSVLGGPGHADQVVHMDDITTGGQLSDKLSGLLRGVLFLNSGGRSTPLLNGNSMLVVVDGIVMLDKPPFDVNSLANDVETVEVLKYANATIYGVGAANGVIVFTTKIGRQRSAKEIPSFGILPITPRGYYLSRVFYSPRYDSPAANLKKKDLRTTIYWNPDVNTGKDGNVSIDFYNADGPGTYRMVIEGIDGKGNLGRQVFRYTVQ